MKKYIWVIAMFICFLNNHITAQSLAWQWTKQGNMNGEVGAVAADNEGNAVISGVIGYNDTAYFDNYTIYPNPTFYTHFLVKYSSAGQVLWVFTLPRMSSFSLTNVATDINNNIYVVGATQGELYLMKVNSNGNLLWIDSAGNISHNAIAIATDANGNVCLTGAFDATTIVFGNDTVWGSTGNFSPFHNYFVVKYSPAGSVLWAGTALPITHGLATPAEGTAVAIDRDNNTLIGGRCSADSLIFNTITTHGPGLNLHYEVDNSFVAKYEHNNVIWAKTLSSIGTSVTGICTDNADNVYAYGFFQDSLYIDDSLWLKRTGEDYNLFVIKFSPAGKPLWVLGSHSHGTGPILPFVIIADKHDHLLISGGTFDTFSWTADSIYYSYNDIGALNDKSFILMLDTSGQIVCGQTFTQGGDDANGLAADPYGYVYWAGDHIGSAFVIGADTLYSNPQAENSYIAKFIPCGEIVNDINEINYVNASLKVYPNPVSGSAIIDYNIPNNTTNAMLNVVDILGSIRKTLPLENAHDRVSINTKGLSAGIYLVTIVADGGVVATQKVVVKQ